jgi:hypothetical protein
MFKEKIMCKECGSQDLRHINSELGDFGFKLDGKTANLFACADCKTIEVKSSDN